MRQYKRELLVESDLTLNTVASSIVSECGVDVKSVKCYNYMTF